MSKYKILNDNDLKDVSGGSMDDLGTFQPLPVVTSSKDGGAVFNADSDNQTDETN